MNDLASPLHNNYVDLSNLSFVGISSNKIGKRSPSRKPVLTTITEVELLEHETIKEYAEVKDQLRKAEAKYRTLVEQIPAITYIASLEEPGKLLYLSPQILQLGYSAEYWLDDQCGLLKRVHPDDLAATIEAYTHTYEHHAPLRCEYRLIKSDGRVRWILDEANIVRNERGGSLFLQGLLVDISKDKEIENELRFYRQRLEEMVLQRTEQLEKQNSLLKCANRNLGKALFELRRTKSKLIRQPVKHLKLAKAKLQNAVL